MPESNIELWKPIKNYENFYLISNQGNVKSLPRTVNVNCHGIICKRKTKEKILKPQKNGRHESYFTVNLSIYNTQKIFCVHRLVAEAFIPNPNNLPCVNHKDENTYNNCFENLEWRTAEYNNNYGNRNKKISKILTGRPGLKGKLNPNFGKHKSMESRIKMSEKAKIREMRKRGEIIGK